MAPETMGSTLPNTDQPRIPHSEYHYIFRRGSSLRHVQGVPEVSYSHTGEACASGPAPRSKTDFGVVNVGAGQK